MSRQVRSFDRSKKVDRDSYETYRSLAVKFHVTGSYERKNTKMNGNDSAPPHLLMQNVRDIRKRLLETEKTLNTLTKAEARLDHE